MNGPAVYVFVHSITRRVSYCRVHYVTGVIALNKDEEKSQKMQFSFL